ncbi:MAG: DUF1858 domain-containing protein [Clostridiaceae bacterium]|nr:DUF1858 domain-containing protein [Clostridiaceae bacterium]
MVVTSETVIGDILDADMNAAMVLMEMGMHCVGCPSSRGESLAEASMVHGINVDELVDRLNAYFAEN